MVLVRPITLNFTEPMVFLLNLYTTLIYGLLYIWFESFPIVFVEIHGFNLGQDGLVFLGIMIGALVTIPPFFAYLHFVQENQFNENGELKPEKCLPPAMAGGFFTPICLFWFGWSAQPSIHWIMPIIGSGFLFRRRFPALQFCPRLPLRRLSGLCCLSICRQRLHAQLLRHGVPALCVCDVQKSGRELGE